MELIGKKIAFLGDSITQGCGCSTFENGFVGVFGRKTGAEAQNYGIGGTRIARKHRRSADPIWDQCFLDRVETMDRDADCVVVFGGTNDFGHGDGGIGVFEDRDEFTFYGALHSLINRLIYRYPDKKIVFMTPLHRTSENITTNEIGLPRVKLVEYVRAIREVCEYYSIPVIDLYAESGLQPAVEILKRLYMPDGLHPNDAGAQKLAAVVETGLRRL